MKKNASMINIGASRESVIEAEKVILKILDSNHEEETIQEAFKTFREICKVENVYISNCVFENK